MKKADASDQRTMSEASKSSAPPIAFKPPFKPRPRVFYALLGVLAMWIAALLALYFVTVYPTRREPGAATSGDMTAEHAEAYRKVPTAR